MVVKTIATRPSFKETESSGREDLENESESSGGEEDGSVDVRDRETSEDEAAERDDRANQRGESESDADSEPERKAPGNAMANAFAEILGHPGSSQKGIEAPILLGSKSLAKRKRQELEASATEHRSKQLRQEIRQRAHKKIPKKGENPEEDAQEKLLQKIATRGVVQLFNAVAKAQKSKKEALASGAKVKDATMSKSGFFSELKRDVAKDQAAKKSGQKAEDASEKTWDVLKPDFAGLQGKSSVKMKDWDKPPNQDVAASSTSEKSSSESDDSDNEGLGVW